MRLLFACCEIDDRSRIWWRVALLIRAAFEGDGARVAEMLGGGILPDMKNDGTGWTPLLVAVVKGHLVIVQMLLDKRCEY